MCGIFALLYNSNFNIEEYSDDIYNKINNIKCRGPETTNIKIYNELNLCLGFHRLAINGLNPTSGQPLEINNCVLICNGEIYNFKELYDTEKFENYTDSDCEILIHMYKKYGIYETIQKVKGVFAFCLVDLEKKEVFIGRDPFGVRPLFESKFNMKRRENDWDDHPSMRYFDCFGFCSESKGLLEYDDTVRQHEPSSYSWFRFIDEGDDRKYWFKSNRVKYYSLPVSIPLNKDEEEEDYFTKIRYNLLKAVKKRVLTTERPIACLLSGGLDSSLISMAVKKYIKGDLETYSIGFENSEDLKNAQLVADYIGSKHTTILVKEQDFLDAIDEVIRITETYDTTTIRASVGNYLVGKYIKEHSDAKVIFNGDGSDEVTGGYLYFHKAPNAEEFDKECRRLVDNIHYFDVLRSDRCISCHGLEPRTPFLDVDFVDEYFKISKEVRFHKNPGKNDCEKYMLRKAFVGELPDQVLWRTKEAFSDGVSGDKKSWFEVIKDYLDEKYPEYYDKLQLEDSTIEKWYYYKKFQEYGYSENIIPYYWMPKYVNAKDASARTLNVYNEVQNK
jgi:asparagine synthase (glutamine-hydrolysing)